MNSFRLRDLFRLRVFGSALLLTSLVGVAAAQQPEETLVTNTALVQLNVGVVDKQGHAITTLSQNDFAVYEDGVRRPIAVFEPSQAPFSLVMLLDTSGSTLAFRQQIEQAALRFLDALAPGDRVSVVEFNGKGVKSELGFNSDLRRVAYAIAYTMQAKGRGDTPLYDALEFSLRELRREGKRRKAIVVLTDGIDTEARNGDRSALAKVSDSELATALKPESYSRLVSVLGDADRDGVTIFPLALGLGLVHGASPALADRAARLLAEAGMTQQRALRRLKQEHGVGRCIGLMQAPGVTQRNRVPIRRGSRLLHVQRHRVHQVHRVPLIRQPVRVSARPATHVEDAGGWPGQVALQNELRPREFEPARPAEETRLLDPFAVVRQDLGGQTRGELVRHAMNSITHRP